MYLGQVPAEEGDHGHTSRSPGSWNHEVFRRRSRTRWRRAGCGPRADPRIGRSQRRWEDHVARSAAGLAVADGGKLEILGAPVGRALAVPDGVAGFVDGPGLYPSLTARKNLAALAALRGGDPGLMGIGDALEQVGLTDVADDRVRGFSLGMRQRLGLAAALITKPRRSYSTNRPTASIRPARSTCTASSPGWPRTEPR